MNFKLSNYKISTRIILAFSFVGLVLISVIFIMFSNSNKIIKSTDLIIHTHDVLTKIASIEAKLIDLETGQRGFIITNKIEYLEPYNNSLKLLDNKLDQLRILTSDNPSQTKRIGSLEQLIAAKLAELNTTIELRRNESFETAKKIVDTDDGKLIMDKIRVQLAEIKDEELRLLAIRSMGPVASKNMTNYILIGLLLYSLIITVMIAHFTSRSITNPIKTLIKSTKIIGQGNLGYKIGIKTTDEIGSLSRSFELMLQNLKTIMASKDVLEEEIASRKITEQKLRETKLILKKNELQLIESNITKDKFLSIIAHDLRDPFNTLLGFSKLLEESFDDFNVDQQKEFVSIVNKGLVNTFSLLENLLVWSRARGSFIDYEPQTQSLYLLIKHNIDLMHLSAKSKAINIKTEIPYDISITVDKNMFDTIIRNLLSNAIKFTPENGEITLVAHLKTDINTYNYVEIKVEDNGIGIPEATRSELFDIGETVTTRGTANEVGTGLGLYISQDFIKKHGGKIWVESEVGKGSSFYFTLPNASYLSEN